MSGLAEPRFEADSRHEFRIFIVPKWMAFDIPSSRNAFHVIGQDMTWHPHALESMYHSNEEAFLLGIGKEFQIPFAAVMAYLFPEEGRNRYEWQPAYGGGYVIDTTGRSWAHLTACRCGSC